ncbi:hypothetical protein ACJJTC_014426 [Scirpophaga incertulas]
MSGKKVFASPKAVKPKRPSTVLPSTSRQSMKPSIDRPASKNSIQRNSTFCGDADTTNIESQNPKFDIERKIAYGKYLRAILEDSLVDEKIAREEDQLDIQMSLLADRFKLSIEQLDKTSRRLKDIKFVVEQKRLLDLKNSDTDQFLNISDNSKAPDLLSSLNRIEETCLDKLHTKNIDFGYNKDSGHQQLLDAVNDAVEGLNEIKKHSNLNPEVFEEHKNSQSIIKMMEDDRLDLETLSTEFEEKFPRFCEELVMKSSNMIANIKLTDEDDD